MEHRVSEQGGGAPEGAGAQAEAQGAEQHSQHSQPAEFADNPNAKYLTAANVPAELAPLVMEALKHKDADVTRGFQEHKQFRETWEPYSKVQGLNEMDPEDLSALVEWSRTMENPEAFQAWYQGVGEQLGLNNSELDEDSWVRMGEERGWFEGGEGEGGEQQGLDQSSVQQMVREMLQQEMQPVQQWLGSQQHNQAAEQIKSGWEQQLTSLAQPHGIQLKDEQGKNTEAFEDILHLMAGYLEDKVEDPAGQAFERYMRIKGQAQGDLMENKLGQPGGALNGGSPDTRPEQASWNGGGPDPKALALARYRQ
jgi:hypothetical protein